MAVVDEVADCVDTHTAYRCHPIARKCKPADFPQHFPEGRAGGATPHQSQLEQVAYAEPDKELDGFCPHLAIGVEHPRTVPQKRVGDPGHIPHGV